MAEHEHGKMDISVQEKTFEGFIKWSSYGAIGAILALILIALINV